MNRGARLLSITASVFAGWLALHVFFAADNVMSMAMRGIPFSPSELLVQALVRSLIWTLLTPILVWSVRRLDIPRRPARRYIVHLLLIVVMIAVIRSIIAIFVGSWQEGVPLTLEAAQTALLFATHGNAILAAIGVTALLLWDFREAGRERERLRAQLTEAKLQQLRSQLRPHFLFNTLNTIATLVHSDAKTSDEMITSLSDLLRASFELGDRQEITLADELDLVRKYLGIQQARFRERLAVHVDASDDVLDVPVPAFLLQPIVENAVVHSISPRRDGGRIEVRAVREGDALRIDVRDDGSGFDPEQGRRGVGLTTTIERLQALYGDAQRVEFRGGDGFTVTIRIPARARIAA